MPPSRTGPVQTIADAPRDVAVSDPKVLVRGFRTLERYQVHLTTEEGADIHQTRDVLRSGHTVGVLPIDPERGEVVLIRQFRLAAHLMTGKGDLIELVAGYVDGDERPNAAARRECIEEIGVAPRALVQLFCFMPAPGIMDEFGTLYLAIVDAATVPQRAGLASEAEDTRPFRLKIDVALSMLTGATVCSGYLLLALQWLGLNRGRLETIIREANLITT
jgi:ADP-ribose pyrophosphatase